MDRIAVITRCHYQKDDPKFINRVEMYKKYTLKSLLAQTDSDFDIWVWCEPWHDELFLNINPRIKVCHGTYKPRTGKFFIDYTPYENMSGIPKYTTQLNIDSDDELEPTAIEELRKHLNGGRKAISFQPIKHDLDTGKRYSMKNYSDIDRLAPIFAIYQPDEPYIYVHQYGHYSGMPLQFKDKVYLYDLAVMNIHNENESTRANVKGDKEIK